MISHFFNSIIQEYKGIGFILNDSPEPWNIGFQDGVSPGYSGIIDLHDNIFFYLVVIAILVFWMLGSTIYYFNNVKSQITHKYLVHGTLIEVLWTIFPAIVLLAIAIPSFRLLYILDEVTLPTITIKVTGHQWYWSYEYSDYETESGEPIEYDSYMKPESDLEVGDYRLLEVDNPIVIPAETHVRFIITSSDVLHDFALPAAGVKMDAAPARLNQTSFEALREGSLFGQCSELCGPYHGFMPIEVKVTSVDEYLTWIDSLVFSWIGTNLLKNKKGLNSFYSSINLNKSIPQVQIYNLLQRTSTLQSNKSFKDNFIFYMDLFLYSLVVSLLMFHILCLLNYTLDFIFNDSNNIFYAMATNSGSTNTSGSTSSTTTISQTTTTILHNNNNWSNAIRSLFIYGSGGLRLSLARGGTPSTRLFVIGSTLALDGANRLMTNIINDPEYIGKHKKIEVYHQWIIKEMSQLTFLKTLLL